MGPRRADRGCHGGLRTARRRWPVWVRYGRFAKGLIPWPGLFLSECVHYSYGNFISVREEIGRRLPVSITLGVGAATIWLLTGVDVAYAFLDPRVRY